MTFLPVVVASAVLLIATKSYALGPIDLDVPGNLAAIERDRPDHFAKIQRILVEVPRRPTTDGSVATWMRTEFQAQNVQYTELIMTSLPPKKRLAFTLEDTAYVTVITLGGYWAKGLPTRKDTPAK
jgi:hypothetical protein